MDDFRDLVMAGRGAVCEAHVGRRPLVHSEFVRRVETDGDSKPASCIEFFGEWRLMTCLLLSAVLSLVFWVLNR